MLIRPAGRTGLLGAALATGLLVLGAAPASASPYDEPMAAQAYTTPTAQVALPTSPDAAAHASAQPGLFTTASGDTSLASQFRHKAGDMVVTALNFLGVRYRRGGNDADGGFDCSGFTREVFGRSLGLVLPRRADDQAKAAGLIAVMKAELRPGDLVFFNTLRRTFSHVGIYVGDGKFVHAPRPGGEVRIEDMRLVYWAKRFTGARRAEPLSQTFANEPSAPVAVSTSTEASKRLASAAAGH